ncbi:MAG: proteasome accessory factor PafA2 family protein [Candidatus Colwellbacteria bacterium]|nr:proteasome accessory factor PafA2 family protein [Candidatus Colwellbacteria bacterium]
MCTDESEWNRDTEYATGECHGAREASLHSKAGDKIMAGIFSVPRDNGSCLVLIKNNLAHNLEDSNPLASFGAHENIQVFDIPMGDQSVNDALIPFLMSRQIIGGAGCVLSSGEYCYSQRGLMMEYGWGNNTTHNRSMISGHRESHTGSYTQSRRLHIITGDSNMLEYQTWLKLAITNIIVAMMETSASVQFGYSLKRVALPDDKIREQIAIEMADVSRDFINHGRTPLITLGDGSLVSAYDLQARYWEAADKFVRKARFESERWEQETKEAMSAWQSILHAIYRNDTDYLEGRLDHTTKYVVIREYLKRTGKDLFQYPSLLAEKHTFDVMYHRLPISGSNAPTLFERIRNHYKSRMLFSDAEIDQAVENPPQKTRAFMRGKCAATLHGLKKQGRLDGSSILNWDSLSYQGARFEIADPLMYKKDGFETFLHKIEVS